MPRLVHFHFQDRQRRIDTNGVVREVRAPQLTISGTGTLGKGDKKTGRKNGGHSVRDAKNVPLVRAHKTRRSRDRKGRTHARVSIDREALKKERHARRSLRLKASS